MASNKDVAKKANVGVATVSRAINNTGYVSAKTRERIYRAMAELNYEPNQLAINLSLKRSGIIAILVPDIMHPFFNEFISYAELTLKKLGFKTMICNANQYEQNEIEYLKMLKRHTVDGIITAVHTLDTHEYQSIDKPIVALDRFINNDIPLVAVDHESGGILAAKEFIRCRCKRVLQFESERTITSPVQERHEAFRRYMEANGVDVVSRPLQWNHLDNAYFEKVAEAAFAAHPGIDGVFGTDLIVLNFIKVALRNNVRVPNEIKAVAYDGTYITELTNPTVTCIRQPIQSLAQKCVEVLMDKIEGREEAPTFVRLDVTVHRRQSTSME